MHKRRNKDGMGVRCDDVQKLRLYVLPDCALEHGGLQDRVPNNYEYHFEVYLRHLKL